MHKLTILPTIALGALSLAAIGNASPAHAASGPSMGHAVVPHDRSVFAGGNDDSDDGDMNDDDIEGSVSTVSASGGGASSSGAGELPATGGDTSSMILLAGFAVTAGGVAYLVTRQRGKATTLPR